MRKIAGILFITLFLVTASYESTRASRKPVDPMDKGSWILNFGVGLGTQFWGNGYGFGPAAKVAFETGMWKLGPGVLTLGGEMGFSYFGYKYPGGFKETWLNFMFAARSAYHYGFKVPGLDVYGGLPLGIGFCAYNNNLYADQISPGFHRHNPVYPYFGFFLGGSYFFTEQLGINAEIGYNVTYANIGMVFILK